VKKLGFVYTVLTTVAVVVAVAVVAGLYRSGSASVPGWSRLFQPGPLSSRHAFLNGQCEACHTPTKGIEANTCIACHATAAADLGKQPTAFHASIQDCRGCHVEHQGANRPTKIDHAVLVRVATRSTPGAPSRATIPQQMVEDMASYLGTRMLQSAEKTYLDCASCHSNRDPHRELFGRDCASCHETNTWRVARYLHPSPTSRDCAQCHQAPPSHYMMHFEMVSKTVARQEHANVNQCFICHRTDSFNDIKGAGWYKHH
jgi:hypothetical protein